MNIDQDVEEKSFKRLLSAIICVAVFGSVLTFAVFIFVGFLLAKNFL